MMIISSFSSEMYARTLYVDSHNKSNIFNGSKKFPYKSIQQAFDDVKEGDRVLIRTGIYFENLFLEKSGTRNKPILITAEKNVVIDGSKLNANKSISLLYIKDQSHIILENLCFKNLTATTSKATVSGIYIEGKGENIQVEKAIVENIHAYNKENEVGNAHAVAFMGTDALKKISVTNSKISTCSLGGSEALVLNGNIEDFVVSNNVIAHIDNIGIDFIGHEGICQNKNFDFVRSGKCFLNKITRVSTEGNYAYEKGDFSAAGIYIDGGANIIIESNEISECNIGIEVASEHYGENAKDIHLIRNKISQSDQGLIMLGGYSKKMGGVKNITIEENLLLNGDKLSWSVGMISFQYHVQKVKIQKNSFEVNLKDYSSLMVSIRDPDYISDLKFKENQYLSENVYWLINKNKLNLEKWKKKGYDLID